MQPLHFSLTDLRLFIAVAELGNLTLAAQRSHLSTAAASMRIRALEEQANCRLLERLARGMRLTSAGETFAQHARTMLRESQILSQQLRQYAGGLQGHINILANTTACTEVMPSVLAQFLPAHPQVSVRMQETNNTAIAQAVREGRADMGVLAGEVDFTGLVRWRFASDRVVAVVSTGHPWAERASVGFAELMEQPLISLNQGSSMRDFVGEKLVSMGLPSIQPRVEVGSFDAVCMLVAAGIGVSLAGESVMLRYRDRHAIALLPLHEAWGFRERSVVVRDSVVHPPYLKQLIEAILQEWGHGLQRDAADAVPVD